MVELDGLHEVVWRRHPGASDDGEAEVQDSPAVQLQGQEGDQGLQRAPLLEGGEVGGGWVGEVGGVGGFGGGPELVKEMGTWPPNLQKCTPVRAARAHAGICGAV